MIRRALVEDSLVVSDDAFHPFAILKICSFLPASVHQEVSIPEDLRTITRLTCFPDQAAKPKDPNLLGAVWLCAPLRSIIDRRKQSHTPKTGSNSSRLRRSAAEQLPPESCITRPMAAVWYYPSCCGVCLKSSKIHIPQRKP